MRIRERLYLTGDNQVVGENDPRGRQPFAKPGDELSDSVAEAYGLIDGGPPRKAAQPAENKMATPAPNKSGGVTINRRPIGHRR